MNTDDNVDIEPSKVEPEKVEHDIKPESDLQTKNEELPKNVEATTSDLSLQGRFSFDSNGQILWQKDISNPMPGNAVGYLTKGLAFFQPSVVVLSDVEYTQDANLEKDLNEWVVATIDRHLGGITRFANAEALPDPLKGIAKALKEHFGTVDRYAIDQYIKELDADMRKILRQHKVRLGPIIAYYYEHLKPEPQRIKTILWALHNDLDTTPTRPKDGVVSEEVSADQIDKALYKILGYPLYGDRAIRIDMLDRVINDIYDSAETGQFRAQHKYAEWLGCSIEALYKALEAMGHFKIEGTEDIRATDDKTNDDLAKVTEALTDNQTNSNDAKKDAKADETVAALQTHNDTQEQAPEKTQEKPNLSLFKLKKGKLSVAPDDRKKNAQFGGGQKDKPASKPSFKSNKRKKDMNKKSKGPKVMSFGSDKAALSDSPFAVLKDLDLSK